MKLTRRDSGQATAELALVLPFLLTLALFMVQAALVLRDHLALISAAREAVRVASVDPDPAAAQEAAETVLPGAVVRVGPHRVAGQPLAVEVAYRSVTAVPLVGRALPDPQLRTRAVMRVER